MIDRRGRSGSVTRHGAVCFWLSIALLVFLCVPYLFMGQSEPRLAGLPVWLHVSLGASLMIAVLSMWRIWKRWDAG